MHIHIHVYIYMHTLLTHINGIERDGGRDRDRERERECCTVESYSWGLGLLQDGVALSCSVCVHIGLMGSFP